MMKMVHFDLLFQDKLVDVESMSDEDDENNNKHGNLVMKTLFVEGEIRDQWTKVAPCCDALKVLVSVVFLNSNIFLFVSFDQQQNIEKGLRRIRKKGEEKVSQWG